MQPNLYNATDYANWQLTLKSVVSAVAMQAQLNLGYVTIKGRKVNPLAASQVLSIDLGTSHENVTVTSITNPQAENGFPPTAFLATFTKAHARKAVVATSTNGLQEAVIDAINQGGGLVIIDNTWPGASGSAVITALPVGSTTVGIQDVRSGSLTAYAWGGSAYAAVGNAGGTAVVLNPSGDQTISGAHALHISNGWILADGTITTVVSDGINPLTLNTIFDGSGDGRSGTAGGIYVGTTITNYTNPGVEQFGVDSEPGIVGTGTYDKIAGLFTTPWQDAGISSGGMYGLYVDINNYGDPATLTTGNFGIFIADQHGISGVANKALAIADQGTGANDYAIYIAGGKNNLGPQATSVGQLLVTAPAVPANAAASGVAGTIAWDTGFIYVCTATNTWKRVAIATW